MAGGAGIPPAWCDRSGKQRESFVLRRKARIAQVVEGMHKRRFLRGHSRWQRGACIGGGNIQRSHERKCCRVQRGTRAAVRFESGATGEVGSLPYFEPGVPGAKLTRRCGGGADFELSDRLRELRRGSESTKEPTLARLSRGLPSRRCSWRRIASTRLRDAFTPGRTWCAWGATSAEEQLPISEVWALGVSACCVSRV